MVEKLYVVLSALGQAGFRVRRGTLNTKAILPESPVVVVYPEKSAAEQIVVAAEVYGTVAVNCESIAYEVASVLQGIRGKCTVDRCQYSGVTGLFSVKVLAQWQVPLMQTVYLDGAPLGNLTGFQAKSVSEVVMAEDGSVSQTQWVWELTVEELLSESAAPKTQDSDAHTLRVETEGGSEIYSACYFTSVLRQGDSRGTVQVRTLKCWDRTVS